MAVTLIAGLAAAGSAWAAAGFAISLGAAFGAFAIGAGLSLVSRALMPKLDMGSQMGGRSVTTREAAHTRKIVYGRARIGGNIVYLESTGADNKYLWLVIAVAAHEIDAYESVYFNDEKIWNGTNYLNGWGSFVSISFHKGDQTTADSGLDTVSTKWTSDHILFDTAYMVVKLTYDRDQFGSGLPNISTIIRGKKVLDPDAIDSGSFVVGERYQIATIGATATDFTAIGASANTVGLVFTATGIGSGDGTALLIAWSQNPALCIYDYLRDTKYGLGEVAGNILTASVNTAVGVCNEAITLAAGGTQARYTIDGVVDTGNSIKSNIETMVGSMAGRLVYSGGLFEIHAGEYVAPSITVDESQIIGEITVQTKQSRRNAYNGVKGVFLSEDDNYILADYPAQISSSYAVQDGDPIYLDMALPYTTNNIRAQRLAKLALFRSRQQEAITIPCNLSALRFKIGDNIGVTNTRLGYSAKVFEVVGYSMDFRSDGQIVVNVDAIETASSIWDWTTTDEEVYLGAGEVALYDGSVAVAPTSINVTSDSFLSDDGTFNSQFNVAWTNADDAFTDHYVVEWKLAASTNYFNQTTKSTPFSIVNLVNNASYNVRVKAVNGLGVSSAYLSATETSAIDATAPDAPTSVSAKNEFEQATVAWVNPTANDFSHVDVYGSDSSGSGFALIGKSAGTTFTESELGTGVTRYYKLKAVDYTGNASVYSATVNATTTQVPIGGIADDAVDTDQIADDAVDTAQIADLAVETAQLDNDAVTIAKIATSLQSTNYVSGTSGWKILKSGVVEFEEATIRGNISATTGDIGGFTVEATSLIAGTGATRVSLSTADGIHLGNNTFASAPFRVSLAGALTATSATISGDLTLTNVDGATVVYSGGNLQVGTVDQDNISVTNLAAINADMGTITAGSISSALITGDVTEVYPIGQYYYTALTSSAATLGSFTLPAPTSGILKRQKIDINVLFKIVNSAQTPIAQAAIVFTVEKKSKGVNAVSVGTVTVESESLAYNQLLSLSGNVLDSLDVSGGVAASVDASGTNEPAYIQAVFYDSVSNKTYVQCSAYTDLFSTSDTLYFSDSKFTSAGTWVTPTTTEVIYVPTPPDPSAGVGNLSIYLPFKMSYGQTTTLTDYRVRAHVSNAQSGVTYTAHRMVGTLENIS